MPRTSSPQANAERLRRLAVRRGKVGPLLYALREKSYLLLPALATVLILSSTHIILGPVQNRSGDNMYHLMNEYAMANAIKAGDNPFGPLGMEFGQPLARFYQILFYMTNIVVHLVLGVHLTFAHNLAIVICFCLSPFTYCYFLRKLGLRKWAAGIGSLVSMTSIAAFGNSFEAYHQAGIVTQSMGGLFFPWFMGCYIGMLRGENRAITTAMLFALAFLSHATMAVFAVFAGALYFAVTPIPLKAVWKKMAWFCVFGSTLVAFWVLPFLAHTYEMRPVPDSIIRGRRVHWFTSVSKAELTTMLTTGRLLDDPPRKGKQRDADDKLMDRISIIGTIKPRPPVTSSFLAISMVVVLFGWRRASRRYLLAGFIFSLMLFTGPDDFRWLKYLPFIKQIQTFRCTYLVEFFAFGMIGIGLETLLRRLWHFALSRRRFLTYPLCFAFLCLAGGVIGWCGAEIVLLGRTHLVVRRTAYLDSMIDGCSTLPNNGFPFRISPIYKGRFKLRQAWLVMHGHQAYCTHWKGTGPTSAFHLCRSLGSIDRHGDLAALAGIRYITGQGDRVAGMTKKVDSEGDPVLTRLPNGRDRRKKPNDWHYLLDSGRENFLRPLVGSPVPVVSSHAQWIWLNRSWTTRYRSYLRGRNTPIPMRVRTGHLEESGLLERAKAVIYLDHQRIEADRAALDRFARKGGTVLSPTVIHGVGAKTITPADNVWESLPDPLTRFREIPAEKYHRDATDPGLDIVQINRLDKSTRSTQNFVFDIDALAPAIAVLPFEAAPGWTARIDGREVPIFSTGPDMVGIALPAGAHRVQFQWIMPSWHFWTLILSLLAFCGVVGLGVKDYVRKRRSAPRLR